MDELFTDDERKLIKGIEVAGKWDHILQPLSLLIPCFICIWTGARASSWSTVVIGMSVYVVFTACIWRHQAKGMVVLKRVIAKFKEERRQQSPATYSSGAADGPTGNAEE